VRSGGTGTRAKKHPERPGKERDMTVREVRVEVGSLPVQSFAQGRQDLARHDKHQPFENLPLD
jgi:hypothetical protein